MHSKYLVQMYAMWNAPWVICNTAVFKLCFVKTNNRFLIIKLDENLPPRHSWNSPLLGHKRPQKLPPERCKDQRWSCTKTLRGKMQNSKTGRPTSGLFNVAHVCAEDLKKLLYKTAAPTCTHGRQKGGTLTRQDACQVNHPHFESFVDQFQRDSQYQLHYQVAHDVLHTVGVDKAEYTQPQSSGMQDVDSRWFTIVWCRKMF